MLLACNFEPNVLVFMLWVHHWVWWFVLSRRWCCWSDEPGQCRACVCSGMVIAAVWMIMISWYLVPAKVDSWLELDLCQFYVRCEVPWVR